MIVRDMSLAAFLVVSGFAFTKEKNKVVFEISKSDFFKQKSAYEKSAFRQHHDIMKSLIASA